MILPLFDHCDMSLSGALIFFINSFVIKEVAKLVYSIIILPLFDYCGIAWRNFELQHDMDILKRQQNRSVCITLWKNSASYPEVCLTSFLLPMVPCASSPVTRVLCLPLRKKTKRLRGRQEEGPFFLVAKKWLMNLTTSLSRLFPSNENGPLHLSFVLRLRLFFLMIAERPRAQRVQRSPIAIMGRDRKKETYRCQIIWNDVSIRPYVCTYSGRRGKNSLG